MASRLGSGDATKLAKKSRVCANRSKASYVHTTIFPGDEFTFNELSCILVLAEDKQIAEHHILAVQVHTYRCTVVDGPD